MSRFFRRKNEWNQSAADNKKREQKKYWGQTLYQTGIKRKNGKNDCLLEAKLSLKHPFPILRNTLVMRILSTRALFSLRCGKKEHNGEIGPMTEAPSLGDREFRGSNTTRNHYGNRC
ncbi:hypothetical protein CEXT_772651 [Caerostris extrusa]|uniref:Uncharacterized protein n=1 Tax=Caerostris extrusa TaxID=172846 RepID=A0AAV4NPV2_CAEEX|nr:hypothetical protein CEXT_772651 [Caerostris extrusa]